MTKKLLMQSDDYGITDAVSAGIREAIRFGLIRNTGMFVNMPASVKAAQDIRDMDVCLGIDINYVCGRPVSDPEKIPHMVDENGMFFSSGTVSRRSQLISMDELGLISTFAEDPYPYEEILLETENQVKRFIELTGKKPEYMHPHSLLTPNCVKAAKEVANQYGIMHSLDMMHRCKILPHTFDGFKGNTLDEQLAFDAEKNILENGLPAVREGDTCYFICHCGYNDYELFTYTTLTLRRIRDLYAMRSEKVKNYIQENEIELITYRNLI